MSYVCLEDFEKVAYNRLEKSALNFYRSGAGEEFTLNLNREAFKRLRIRPRFLRDVSNIDTTSNILGFKADLPLGIAPVGMQKLAHENGEAGTACATGKAGSIFILSTMSTMSIEEVAEAAPDTHKWFQLYVQKDRLLTLSLVHRAEKCNYKAIVLTIDVPVLGQRRTAIRDNFSLPSNQRLANFDGECSMLDQTNLMDYTQKQFDATLTWRDIEWLIKETKLPVIVKGVLTAEDALLVYEFGCAGIIVSNHGARQLDSVPATIEVLPEIVKAVGGKLHVMLDGGIMTGNDIIKALALGAEMVFIGRPVLWSLTCNGQSGVEHMFDILKNDFRRVMALTGCKSLKDIRPEMVVHESYYAKL